MTPPPRFALRSLAFATLALGLLASTGARAAEPDRAALAGGDAWARVAVPAELRAGERTTLSFGPAPAGVEELELLLSLDGGRTWPVRVSRERDARECALDWRVPNLPAARAMVRVRYRIDGREIEGPPSRAFAIVGNPRSAQELDVFHEGNWWEGLPAVGRGEAAALASGDTPSLQRHTTVPIAESPTPSAMISPPASRAARSRASSRLSAGRAEPPRVTPPFSPLRI